MTAVGEPLAGEHLTARREERLLRLLERASASSRFNLGERWLFGLGGALVVAGFVVVVIGWAGASRTVLVAGQIPYLLSGGLIGLGLVFLGGFLYFGHWMAVLVRESRERGAEDREDLALVRGSLAEINRSLAALAAAVLASADGRPPASFELARIEAASFGHAPSEPVAASSGASPASLSSNGTLTARTGALAPERAGALAPERAGALAPERAGAYPLLATAKGTMAHRPGCRALAGKPNLRQVGPADGLKPCGMCRPLDHDGFQ